jgi:hypothetical protein
VKFFLLRRCSFINYNSSGGFQRNLERYARLKKKKKKKKKKDESDSLIRTESRPAQSLQALRFARKTSRSLRALNATRPPSLPRRVGFTRAPLRLLNSDPVVLIPGTSLSKRFSLHRNQTHQHLPHTFRPCRRSTHVARTQPLQRTLMGTQHHPRLLLSSLTLV